MAGQPYPWEVKALAAAFMENDMKDEKYRLGEKTGTFGDPATQSRFEAWVAAGGWDAVKHKYERK